MKTIIQKLSVVVPVYNEEKTLEEVMIGLFSQLASLPCDYEVIAVNDGSSDNSGNILEELCLKYDKLVYLAQSKNNGKGSAIKFSLKFITGDYVLIQDADLEYDVADIKSLVEAVINSGDVVFGSRFFSREYKLNIYYYGNVFFTKLFNLIYGASLSDLHTCYKLIPASVFKKINFHSKGFGFCIEATARVLFLNKKILEVPIAYYPRKRTDGKKLKLFHAFIMLFQLFYFRFRN